MRRKSFRFACAAQSARAHADDLAHSSEGVCRAVFARQTSCPARRAGQLYNRHDAHKRNDWHLHGAEPGGAGLGPAAGEAPMLSAP